MSRAERRGWQQWRAIFASFAVAVGSAVVLSSGFLTWFHLHRDYSGFRLAQLVTALGDDYPIVPPSWLGVTWYVLPALAAGSWVALFHRGIVAVRSIHLALGLLMAAMACGYGVAAARYGQIAMGEVAACAGALLVVAGWAIRPICSSGGSNEPMETS